MAMVYSMSQYATEKQMGVLPTLFYKAAAERRKMSEKFVQTLGFFKRNYKGFDWKNGKVILVKNNRPHICTGCWKHLIEKYKDCPVRDWTHDKEVMVITL